MDPHFWQASDTQHATRNKQRATSDRQRATRKQVGMSSLGLERGPKIGWWVPQRKTIKPTTVWAPHSPSTLFGGPFTARNGLGRGRPGSANAQRGTKRGPKRPPKGRQTPLRPVPSRSNAPSVTKMPRSWTVLGHVRPGTGAFRGPCRAVLSHFTITKPHLGGARRGRKPIAWPCLGLCGSNSPTSGGFHPSVPVLVRPRATPTQAGIGLHENAL